MILTVTLNTAIDKLYRVDALQPGTVMRVQEVSNTAGGKGLNVSRVAALLGEDVVALGFVGGHIGRQLESLLTQPRVEKAFTHVAADTRCCINIRDEATGKSTEFLEPGSPVTQDDVDAFVRDFTAQLPRAAVVTISGSMPKGVPEDFYATLIRLAKQQGKPVLLDTSGAALQNALPARPAFIKPNTDEIRQILDVDITSRAQLIEAARRLHTGGIPMVAVSLGKEGVLVVCEQGVFHGITPDLPVVNTVGSGDSMVAGFAVSLARGQSVENAIRTAVAVSTANTQTKETGFYRQEDFDAILPLVTVERL